MPRCVQDAACARSLARSSPPSGAPSCSRVQADRTCSNAPLVSIRTRPSTRTITLRRLRTKSYGISVSLVAPARGACCAFWMASSSGLTRPVCSDALVTASVITRAAACPCASQAPSSCTTPSVSVPVLSVQSTSMLPRFSIALRCRTSTPCAAMLCAPRARLMLRMAGSSSGLRPTASAIANSSVSTSGRPSSRLITSTAVIITVMAVVSR